MVVFFFLNGPQVAIGGTAVIEIQPFIVGFPSFSCLKFCPVSTKFKDGTNLNIWHMETREEY